MKKYKAVDIEKKHREAWDKSGIYSYDAGDSVKKTFVIDTPPPTVSGALHIGHLFSYTQTDIIARFQRMRGKNVFYPMGWDDNGLPTEKRIQNLYGVSCDPSLPWQSMNLQPLSKKDKTRRKISRKNFLELCDRQAREDEKKYHIFWNRLGLSVDWKRSYRTISASSQKISQTAFINLYKKGLLENRLDPVFWDVRFQTAVAQADMEDRQREGFYHDIKFQVQEGGEVVISTTRPELLPACVALAAHPEDSRYQSFFSKTAVIPLFHGAVPILPSTHADPEKGTGILMICTFGDGEDVRFWKERNPPLKQVVSEEGRMRSSLSFTEGVFQSLKPSVAEKYYHSLSGLSLPQARRKIVELLRETEHLVSEPRPTLQFVKYYEKGDRPLELIPARQWFIKILDHKEKFLERGRQVEWHPPAMRKRYEQWVEGLNQDWCVSRQRFFGVPIPLWYPLNTEGKADFANPILGRGLPVDPVVSAPPGYKEQDRDQPDGFTADADVLDTWATSSLTPLINSSREGESHQTLFPADLRPQAHEIIRTWAFYTIVQSHFHENSPPWKKIAVSGWVVDPTRSKMSKSKGNIVTPDKLMDTYSADALRYWAGRAGLGQDTVYDEQVFKTGQRLVTKIFHAARFVCLQTEPIPVSLLLQGDLKGIRETVDRAWVMFLRENYKTVTGFLENFKYDSALRLAEKTFWSFCDNYIELVKARTYQLKGEAEGISGALALDCSLYLFLKMFAPFLPYITEEVWSWRYGGESRSIHCAPWEKGLALTEGISSPWRTDFKEKEEKHTKSVEAGFGEEEAVRQSGGFLDTVFHVLEQIRNQKAGRRLSLSSVVEELTLKGNPQQIKWLDLCRDDLRRAGHIQSMNIIADQDWKDPPHISLTLDEGGGGSEKT